MKILMISKTPLVGAPSRLSTALRMIGVNTDLLILGDYPNHLKGVFPKGNLDNAEQMIESARSADCIWVHNLVSDDILREVKAVTKGLFVLQVHSGTYEGPLFDLILRDDYLSFFDFKAVVAQAWARMYPDFIMVPNIVPQTPFRQDFSDNSPIRIMFTPSHASGGRFGKKYSKVTQKKLVDFERGYVRPPRGRDLNLEIPNSPIEQGNMLKWRSQIHINIDEVFTGGFHQVSLEALCTGGIAVNGGDWLSELSFQNAIETEMSLPFERALGLDELSRALCNLIYDEAYMLEKVEESRSFANRYLGQERLANIIIKKIFGE